MREDLVERSFQKTDQHPRLRCRNPEVRGDHHVITPGGAADDQQATAHRHAAHAFRHPCGTREWHARPCVLPQRQRQQQADAARLADMLSEPLVQAMQQVRQVLASGPGVIYQAVVLDVAQHAQSGGARRSMTRRCEPDLQSLRPGLDDLGHLVGGQDHRQRDHAAAHALAGGDHVRDHTGAVVHAPHQPGAAEPGGYLVNQQQDAVPGAQLTHCLVPPRRCHDSAAGRAVVRLDHHDRDR